MKALLILFFSLFTFYSGSLMAGPYPVVSSIETTITDYRHAAYNITWTVIDIPEADNLAPVGWYIGSAHRHDAFPGGEDTVTIFPQYEQCYNVYCSTRIKANDTFSTAAMRAYNFGQKDGIMNHGGEGNGYECIGYIAVKGGSSKWRNALTPAGTCVYAPPGKDWCKITTPNLTLDHGQVSLDHANQSTATGWANIACTSATKVTLRLASGINYIPLQKNAKAVISANDNVVGGTYDLQPGDNTIKITSELQDINDIGDYSGMSVMIIEPA